jgi:aminoglycoside phosphotransferase (APT) family kinase protein
MERRHGHVIRGRAPRELSNSREMQTAVCRSFIKNLACLHNLDFEAVGLGKIGDANGYDRRQVDGWMKRYLDAKTDNLPNLESVLEWLGANVPETSAASIVHNDYKFDNVMLDPHNLTKITAVLDWEMVTIGDPFMDLGTTLGYWMSKDEDEPLLDMPFNPRVLMTNITRAELADIYAAAVGRDLPDLLFYYVFGTMKIAVIAQQIYARYVRGFTTDQRFAAFNKFVAALGRIAETALEKDSI